MASNHFTRPFSQCFFSVFLFVAFRVCFVFVLLFGYCLFDRPWRHFDQLCVYYVVSINSRFFFVFQKLYTFIKRVARNNHLGVEMLSNTKEINNRLLYFVNTFLPFRYRVVLFGDAGTGKTALVSQFMTSEYMHTYDASLGKFKRNLLFALLCLSVKPFQCGFFFFLALLSKFRNV